MAVRDARGEVLGPVGELFRGGSLAGLDDPALLDRFVEAGSDLAFAALVERHGPMVLRVCRGILGDPHEAEDALQATFLLLALRAGSIRRRGSVAPWLFGAARRVSTRARRAEARRRRRDRVASARRFETTAAPPSPLPEVFEELDRLPGPLRAAVVLCDLEGHSHASAAAMLGCAERTVHSRLYRARRRLRDRLTRRGLAPGAVLGLLAAPPSSRASGSGTGPSPIDPAALARVAARLAAGSTTAGVVPASIATLIRGASTAMTIARLRLMIVPAVALGGIALGAASAVPTGGPVVSFPASRTTPAPASEPARDEPPSPPGPGEILLPRSATGRVLTTEQTITAIAFSPDGRTLATGHGKKLVAFWRVADGQKLGEYRIETPSHHATVMDLEYAPDGKTLAIASDDGFIRLRDVETGKLTLEHNTHFFVWDLAFNPDGKTLAWGLTIPWHDQEPEDGWQAIVLWDLAAGREAARLAGLRAGVAALAYRPNGRRLASVGRDGLVRLWDPDSEQSRVIYEIPALLSTRDLAFSPDGTLLALPLGCERSPSLRIESGRESPSQPADGPAPGVVRLLDADSGAIRADLLGFEERATDVAFSPDGTLVAACGFDETARIWDVASTAGRAILLGHRKGVYDVAFSPDGQTLATGGYDATARLWDLAPILGP